MIASNTVAAAKDSRIERVLEIRGIKLRGRVERVGPCPLCGGRDRFAVNVYKQLWNCRGCGIGGDVISLVQHLEGVDFKTAVIALAGKEYREAGKEHREPNVGQRRGRRADQCYPPDTTQAETMSALAEEIWNQTIPIRGTDGEVYLSKRGIPLADVPENGGLRWHERCPWENGTQPCILARFTDAITGAPKGIRRRPVNGDKPRSLGPTAGCVIRLWPDEDVTQGLVLGTGVETTLAGATRIIHRGTQLRPAWAAGGDGNLAGFPVLAGIEVLTLLVDHDVNESGQRAAARCADRWRVAGREVIRLIPAIAGADFNDVVVAA
jgi:hypothetical protein